VLIVVTKTYFNRDTARCKSKKWSSDPRAQPHSQSPPDLALGVRTIIPPPLASPEPVGHLRLLLLYQDSDWLLWCNSLFPLPFLKCILYAVLGNWLTL